MPWVAVAILLATVAAAVGRPRLGSRRLGPHVAALGGAIACFATGLLDTSDAQHIVDALWRPILTLVCLMVIAIIADRVYLFELLTRALARSANGSGHALFRNLFLVSATTGAILTNDAAVLVFTPLVVRLLDELAEPSWQPRHRTPYYFAVLYVANVVGVFVVSNPINLIFAESLNIEFAEYAFWMFLPALVSIVVSYIGLRVAFRHDIPKTVGIPTIPSRVPNQSPMRRITAATAVLVVAAFFAAEATSIPPWLSACFAAGFLSIAFAFFGGSLPDLFGDVAWDAILFVMGMFAISEALGNSGALDTLKHAILWFEEPSSSIAATGFFAAGASAVLNNHPVAMAMALVIQDLPITQIDQQFYSMAALIGGDLGPKMLPIGSLAALIWFRLLRNKGVEISALQYIRLGIPITLAAVLCALVVLLLERACFAAW